MNRQWKNVCQGSTENEATISNLTPNTKYVFKCRRLGWSPWCPEVVIRSGPGVPSFPIGLNAREIASTSVVITWYLKLIQYYAHSFLLIRLYRGSAERDNGLPVLDYTLRMKSYKSTTFSVLYKGREKVFVPSALSPNTVYIFEVCANNRAGEGIPSNKFAVRTLPEGAAAMTPWVEMIDEKSEKICYVHIKSNALAWALPKGAILDEVASFKSKKEWLTRRVKRRSDEARKSKNLIDSSGSLLYFANKLNIDRNNVMENSLAALQRLSVTGSLHRV